MKAIRSLTLVMIFHLVICCSISAAQPSSPPPPPAGHGLNGNQSPGGMAPIGEGFVMLLSMGAGYALRKTGKGKRCR
jgi:hypothetical protein